MINTRFKMCTCCLIAASLLQASQTASSSTFQIPGEFATIQAAIDSATHGDEIIVSPGTYIETIHFQGKNLRLASTNPRNWAVVESTIIDASKAGSVVTFEGSETEECVLAGFTIRNGSATEGGGVNGDGCEATIEFNDIQGNRAVEVPNVTPGNGGGLHDCDGSIRNNKVRGNFAETKGSALHHCDGLICNNLVVDNETFTEDFGVLSECDGIFLNNTVASNSGIVFYACGAFVANCIFAFNDGGQFPQPNQIYCCYYVGDACEGCLTPPGTLEEDPLFVDRFNGDYRLRSDSPCVNTGNSFYVVGDFIVDLDGNSRIWNGCVDMGCFERASSYDRDGDFLTDSQEEVHNTNPNLRDTDGDSLIDAIEFWRGSNPLVFEEPVGVLVPDDYSYVSEAVFFAYPGERITVGAATYTENLLISKDVDLTGTDPANPDVVASTVLDGGRVGTVVTFSGNEGEACRLKGFTLTRGENHHGGGIRGNGTNATISENRFIQNAAYENSFRPGRGGAIQDCDGIIQRNAIMKNRANYGAGLAECDGWIIENQIADNSSSSVSLYTSSDPALGGGCYDCDGTIAGNEILRNSAGGWGGGLAECDGELRRNRISDNSSSLSGGGIYRCSGSIEENTIDGNTARSFLGGGLFECIGVISKNLIEGNEAREGAGAYGCIGTIASNRFVRNKAEALPILGGFGGIPLIQGGLGGALSGHSGMISGNLFLSNQAVGWFSSKGVGSCSNTLFSEYGGKGGAIHHSTGVVANNLFIGNQVIAPSCRGSGEDQESFLDVNGGAIFRFNGDIVNNTFVSNQALDHGGAISDCSGSIQNCIFWLNSATEDGQIYNSSLPDHCLIQDWTGGGIGNIDLDPKFVDPENGDFHLRHDSPCIDSGVLIASVTDDHDGNPRPFKWSTQYGGDGSGYDMGAFEFYPGPDVNYDHAVDGLDLMVFQYDWGSVSDVGAVPYPPSGMATDMDGNGKVDARDLEQFLEGRNSR